MTTHAIHPTGIKLESTVKLKLKKLGKLKDRSMHWLMKEAILQYIEREEQTEKLKHETLSRWEEEAEQNKIVSNKDMMAWLETWGTDHETGRPECEK